ncbi:MAG: retroviral-like aspartic protease family protein [Gammaproteobacteria bacterium]|nr:retroviral-like aspartic protease family protein [Gammaproteobacteria bacterium]
MKIKIIFGLFVFINSQFVYADDIVVLGLFKNKAIVKIDGVQRTLIKGKSSPEGIKLISSDSDIAVLEYQGKQQEYKLGSHVSTSFKKKKLAEASIMPVKGMYPVTGFINGQAINFLVDTGATWIAMNVHHARNLGINFRLGKQGHVTTANGVVPIYLVALDKVRVGEIELRNVEASVLDGDSPPMVLLGNSFLNRVEMQRRGQVMLLRQKY